MSDPRAWRVRRAEVDALLPLRASVLRPGQPMSAARWPGDDEAEHYVAEAPEDGEIVGVASVFFVPFGAEGPKGQLRGMAVAPEARGGGVGLRLLRAVEAAHPEGLWCNARVSALGFYERAGWRVVSEEFEIVGVGPHVKMRFGPS